MGCVRQQFRNAGEIDYDIESGARHILLVIEFTAIVTVVMRSAIEMYLERAAVDSASIPDEINPFGDGCVHFGDVDWNCGLHLKPPIQTELSEELRSSKKDMGSF
jgi:hypothetical protein